jgi:hypothetical protein
MRNYFAALAALLLIAAAVFLPGELAQWNDTALLDEPHILRQEEEREGFAEQMQLTVGEKLLLLRSGKLSKVPLEEAYLTDEGTEMAFHYAISAGGVVEFYVEPYLGASAAVGLDPGELIAASSTAFATDKTLEMLDSAAQASAQEWTDRLESVLSELQKLQSTGAMPSLWDSRETAEVTDRALSVYVDRDTQLSFQTYSLTLSCAPYKLAVTVDAQSGKLLGFILRWYNNFQPYWGYRGAERFGTAWRDYWGLDSVSPGWSNSYNKEILENAEEAVRMNGDYNANSQINFTYNDQTLQIPLTSNATSNRRHWLEPLILPFSFVYKRKRKRKRKNFLSAKLRFAHVSQRR